MVIRYSISLDDHKAYQHAVRSAVPGFLQIRCVQSIGGPLCLLFLVWIATHFEYGWWPTVIGILIAPLLGIYLWRESPGLWRRSRLDEMYRSGKLNGHVGEHSLELREDGLVERNAAGEHLSHWDQIDNIHSTANRTFFVTKTQLAYILPESSVTSGNYESFVAAAVAEWRKHGG